MALERDFERWHLSPIETKQYRQATTWLIKDRTYHKPWVPAICDRHPFRNVSECVWSSALGPGYPGRNVDRAGQPYWRRMARLNYRWTVRRGWAEFDNYGAPKPDYVVIDPTGHVIGIWYPNTCTSCGIAAHYSCSCKGRYVSILKPEHFKKVSSGDQRIVDSEFS